MSCLSSLSLRFITPDWIGYLWGPEEDRKTGEDREPAAFNPVSPYKWNEHAVYRLENDKPPFSPKKPLPVCLPKRTETIRASRIRSFEDYAKHSSPNASLQSDGNTDREIIELHLPPSTRLVRGRVIGEVPHGLTLWNYNQTFVEHGAKP
ncbi:unnamed protein product [Penicillium roqueforti FM164]|uniref:Genomic scaffold, ProqFM164S03 n=1 Tax=Penicillium roqueforti (strain FM164) TaxID=1365484 RepID=W6QDU9_PENRF|nr:unnamed protein product [Penicillium roqueforti FM164]